MNAHVQRRDVANDVEHASQRKIHWFGAHLISGQHHALTQIQANCAAGHFDAIKLDVRQTGDCAVAEPVLQREAHTALRIRKAAKGVKLLEQHAGNGKSHGTPCLLDGTRLWADLGFLDCAEWPIIAHKTAARDVGTHCSSASGRCSHDSPLRRCYAVAAPQIRRMPQAFPEDEDRGESDSMP